MPLGADIVFGPEAQARLPCHPAGNRAYFLKRLPEAVPDIGDVERIDIAKPGRARYPSYAGRTLRGRSYGTWRCRSIAFYPSRTLAQAMTTAVRNRPPEPGETLRGLWRDHRVEPGPTPNMLAVYDAGVWAHSGEAWYDWKGFSIARSSELNVKPTNWA